MRLFIKQCWRWVRGHVVWVASAWPVWGTLTVVAIIAGLTSLFPGKLDDHIRYCGMALQLLGVLTVVRGLQEKRRLFERPSFLEHIGKWLRQRPRWGSKTQYVMAANSTSFTYVGHAPSISQGVGPDASLEARVASIEANLKVLRHQQGEAARQIQKEVQNRNEALNTERNERMSAMGAIQTQLETFGAGGLHIEAAGLFWLIFGIILATVPSEIAKGFTSVSQAVYIPL